MNLLNLFEDQNVGYENLRALLQAVNTSSEARLKLGGHPITLTYPEARFMVGKYKAYNKSGRQAEFIRDLGDVQRFDLHMKQLRDLIQKQKNFRGSIPGERGVTGDTYPGQLEEQYQGSPKAIGTAFLGLILKHQKNDMPVLVDFEDGQQAFRLTTQAAKDWFVKAFESYRRRGKEDQFLELMGTRIGFQKLVSRFITDNAKAERQRLGITPQKKRTDSLNERDDRESARTRRMLSQLHVQYPYAANDMEALAYSFVNAQKKDRKDIARLEKELDDTEDSVKSDLKQALTKMKSRGERSRGKLSGVTGADERQDALLQKIVALDREQSQAIDDLEKEIGSLPKTPWIGSASKAAPKAAPAEPTSAAIPVAAPAEPTPVASPAPKQSKPKTVKPRVRRTAKKTTAPGDIQLVPGRVPNADTARQLAKTVSSQIAQNPAAAADIVGGNVSDIQTARARRDASRAQGELFNQPRTKQPKVANLEESLRPGEWHDATVTFDDGTKQTVRIPSDEGFRDPIIQHFAKQGKKVVSIDVDWSVRSNDMYEADKKPKPTNPQLWGRAKSAAKSKFDVYPSAYANAWAAKWYKSHGGGWR